MMFPIVKNKIKMRFGVYSKPVGSVVDFWKKSVINVLDCSQMTS